MTAEPTGAKLDRLRQLSVELATRKGWPPPIVFARLRERMVNEGRSIVYIERICQQVATNQDLLWPSVLRTHDPDGPPSRGRCGKCGHRRGACDCHACEHGEPRGVHYCAICRKEKAA